MTWLGHPIKIIKARMRNGILIATILPLEPYPNLWYGSKYEAPAALLKISEKD